jgi:hypothetical protein
MPMEEALTDTGLCRSVARVVLVADPDLVLREDQGAAGARSDAPTRRSASSAIDARVIPAPSPALRSFIDHVIVPALLDRVLRDRSTSVGDASPPVRSTS